MSGVVQWPDLSPYGIRLQLEAAASGERRVTAVAQATDGAAFGHLLEALGFAPAVVGTLENQIRWSRPAGISPREIARLFPLLIMRETPIADIVLSVPLDAELAADAKAEGEQLAAAAPDGPTELDEASDDTDADVPAVRRRGERIDDFGEHIGGAKKERWSRLRGIRFENVTGWTREERATLLTKDRVWPAPNWKQRFEDGADLGVLFRLKRIRDAVLASPGHLVRGYSEGSRRRSTFLRPDASLEDAYLKAIGDVADRLLIVNSPAEACAAFAHYLTPEDAGRARGLRQARLDTPALDALRPFMNERRRGNWSGFLFAGDDFSRDAAAASSVGWPTKTKSVQRSELEAREVPRKPLDHIVRVGGAADLGRDVTAQDFLDTFGFRGGEFGNWVSQTERQASLNHGYTALLDLAAVMQIEPRALSLDGTLAIAFGARGSGRFAAHYEPGRRVINLTKPSGAGALAHEWAHAFDHYLATETGVANNFRRPYASVYGATAKHPRRVDVGTDVLAAMDAFSRRMMTRMMSLDEIDARQNAKWENHIDVAGNWAGWMLSDAKQALYSAATRDIGRIEPAYREQLRAEIDASTPIAALRAVVEIIQQERGWIQEINGATTIAKTLRDAYVAAVGTRREGTNRDNAERVVRTVGPRPIPAATVDAWVDPARRPATETTYANDSTRWDSGRKANPYYSTPWEMFARGLETCVNDALEDRGWQNDYLVHSTRYDAWVGHPKGSPYPHGLDLQELRLQFDALSREIGAFLEGRMAQVSTHDADVEQGDSESPRELASAASFK
ncbi:MAG: LPD1 domain-containing protein [Dokdonella sp.]